jgi:hypothetical protein
MRRSRSVLHALRAVLGVALCALAPVAAGAQLHVAVRVSPVADLSHQIDCVARVIGACATADYTALWRERFLRDAADSAALESWRALRERYGAGVQIETGTQDAVGRELRWVTLGERWRLAGLQARSFDDYRERLALLLLPQDRARAIDALSRFRPRFQAWWDAEARDGLVRGRDSLGVLLARADLRAVVDGAQRFYGATAMRDDTLSLTLVARPGRVRGSTSAELVAGAAVQELLPGASPAREVGVTLHELAHLLLSVAPDSTRQAIAAELARAGVPGRAARALLDEGLATAFGNGLVERALRPTAQFAAYAERPRSFYNDDVIDAAGKALLPVLDSLLRAGATLREPATLQAIQRALATAMGPGLLRPRALLHDLWGFVDERVAEPREVARALQRELNVGNYSVAMDSAGGMPRETLQRDAWIGAVVVAPAASLARLAARGAFEAREVAAMRRAAAAGPVLYGARRANGARTWVIVARSAREAGPLVARLAALERDADGVVR